MVGFYGYGEFEGLRWVGSLELDNEPWQFYEVGVWEDENGGLYLATDSGCSCPIPWENTTRDSLTGPLTEEQAFEEITSLWDGAQRTDRAALEIFIQEVRER